MSDQSEYWAVVEMMGHQRTGALVSEAVLAGAAVLKLQIPGDGAEWRAVQLVPTATLYRLTVCDEDTARAAALSWSPPVSVYDLRQYKALSDPDATLERPALLANPYCPECGNTLRRGWWCDVDGYTEDIDENLIATLRGEPAAELRQGEAPPEGRPLVEFLGIEDGDEDD